MDKQREFSKAQLVSLSSRANLHLLIQGKVYDLHEFVNEHPGGDLVLLGEGGKDATKAWKDVEHSDEAKELMEDYLVGYCSEASSQTPDNDPTPVNSLSSDSSATNLLLRFVYICLAISLGLYWAS